MDAIDLRLLEIFRAVATEGSVSRAADKLNRVQSNVSTRIRQLEDQLSKTLFVRGNRGLALTHDGALLLSYADRLLDLSRQATEALAGGEPRGVLRIGTMESTAAARLPAILSRFHAAYPTVKIQIESNVAQTVLDRLLAGDVDVAFVAEPVRFETLTAVPVFEEELVLVAPQTFPDLDRVEAISGQTMVAFDHGCAYRRYLEDWMLDAGIVPGGTIAVSSYLSLLACVSAGAGYGVAPRSVLDTVHSQGQFRFYPLPPKMRRIRTLMVWRVGYQSVNLAALRTLIPELSANAAGSA